MNGTVKREALKGRMFGSLPLVYVCLRAGNVLLRS